MFIEYHKQKAIFQTQTSANGTSAFERVQNTDTSSFLSEMVRIFGWSLAEAELLPPKILAAEKSYSPRQMSGSSEACSSLTVFRHILAAELSDWNST